MAELKVESKSIVKLLGEEDNHFLIPVYQRPYSWEDDEINKLWEDLIDHFDHFSEIDSEEIDDYFIGSAVFAKKGKNTFEVVDGQQRITSFLLFLRAMYDTSKENEMTGKLKRKIQSALFEINEDGEFDLHMIKIENNAIEKDREGLFYVLTCGLNVDEKYKNTKYFLNYKNFYEKLVSFGADNIGTTKWNSICDNIIDKTIIFPIEADSTDNAIRIFNTVNDRGMELTDADIFKSKIYESYQNNLDEFAKDWRNFEEKAYDIDQTFYDKKAGATTTLFNYLMWIDKAQNGKMDTTIIALRTYFEKECSIDKKTLPLLTTIADFWIDISLSLKSGSKTKSGITLNSLQLIHSLSFLETSQWRIYLTTVWFNHKEDNNFNINDFIFNLTGMIFYQMILKTSSIKLRDNFIKFMNEKEKFPSIKIVSDFAEKFSNIYKESRKLVKPILYLYAYQIPGQKTIIKPDNKSQDVEHILPRQWKDGNYDKWTNEDASEFVEHLGNKMIFERKLNIKATNKMFIRKKQEYKKSFIEEAKKMGNSNQEDWLKNDVIKRERKIFLTLSRKFNWSK